MSATEWRAPGRLPEHILAPPDLGEHRDGVAARHADGTLRRPARRRAGTGWPALLVAEQRGHGRPGPRRAARRPAASGRRARRCRARRSPRSGRWTACTRARSRPASSSGRARSLASEAHICSGVPSNSRPQPSANSVSPQNSAAARSNQKAMWPRVWPGHVEHPTSCLAEARTCRRRRPRRRCRGCGRASRARPDDRAP